MDSQHHLFYQSSCKEVFDYFKSSENGLSKKEILSRQSLYGLNILKEQHHRSWVWSFLGQFKEVLIVLLLVSMGISFYLGDIRGGSILGVIVFINALIGYFQEAKAEKIMKSLKAMLHPIAKVKRNGVLLELDSSELVPGDVVYIEEGDSIPADLRIFAYNNLQTNDFSLTGESNPVAKFTHAINADVVLGERNNCVFMGTTVATGDAWGIVVATGMDTELGKIAFLSAQQETDESPLQKEMKHLSKSLIIGTLILSLVLLVIALFDQFSLREAFVFAVGIGAAMVPQGLPAQVNIALSLAARRLVEQKALVKKLSAVETLGSVSVICTDKTGTLTKNEMTVKHLFVGDKIYDIEGVGYQPEGIFLVKKGDQQVSVKKDFFDQWKNIFLGSILNSHARIASPDNEHQDRYCIGDPTEGALITMAQKAGFFEDIIRSQYKIYHQFGFDSVRKMMSSVCHIDGQDLVYVKGSPQALLDCCDRFFDGNKVCKLSDVQKKSIVDNMDFFAAKAMRTIAFAYKPIGRYDASLTMQEVESGLIFLGFVCITDPPRQEVPFAIKMATQAHIKTIMITGDYGITASAIADTIGLPDGKSRLIFSGEELSHISDNQLLDAIDTFKTVLFCRVSPEDKLRIVSLLKKTKHVVAVTGDGINDAPALKAADIGVAMGKIGTDVAKNVADIVLIDDSFHTLVGAVREGRIIYQNLKKTIISCITSNGGELFTVLGGLVGVSFLNLPLAISTVQILAIDLIGEMGPLTALTWDPPQKNLLKERPRDISKHIINRFVIIDLVWSGALMGLLAYGMYLLFIYLNIGSLVGFSSSHVFYPAATTITYLSILFAQYANILSRRAGISQSAFTSYFWSNKKLLRSFVIGISLVLILLYSPLHTYFGFAPLALGDWIFPLSSGVLFFLIRELYKFVNRKKLFAIS